MPWLQFFTRILRPERSKADLKAELDAHLAMAVTDRVARGEDPAEARRAALREMGSMPLIEDTTRAMWGLAWLDHLRQDVHYALRQIRNSPRFAITVMATLALGIGAAAAMFTVVDHALLRSLPYPQADRVVTLDETNQSGLGFYGVTYPDFLVWRGDNHVFESMALYAGGGESNYLGGAGSVQPVDATRVGLGIFQVLGTQPLLGHAFTANTAPNSILLSYTLWHLRYGNDPKILGKAIEVNGKPYTVTGVMPRGFQFPADGKLPQVWMPVQFTAEDHTRNDNSSGYEVIARLRPGVTPQSAQAEMTVRQKSLARLYPAKVVTREDRVRVVVKKYASTFLGAPTTRALLILLSATGLLWLIACVNVMNLLLARGTSRQREIAMRGALGASRWRILQQLLLEALVLCALAAVLGAGFAEAVVRTFQKAIANQLDLSHPLNLNWPILGALLLLTVATALLASAGPALAAALAPIEPALRQSGAAGLTRRHYRLRALLVVAQIAMSLVLLFSCGLLLRTLYAIRHVPLGFRTDHIAVAHLAIPAYRYAHRNLVADFYQPLLARVQRLPGVQAAGFASEVPLGDTIRLEWNLYMNQKGATKSIGADLRTGTSGLQKVFHFPMLAGRYFEASDTASSQPVVVVNRAFALRYSPDHDHPFAVMGEHLMSIHKGGPAAVIVGVLADIHQDSIEQSHEPEVDLPLSQMTPGGSYYVFAGWEMDLAVRTSLPLEVFLPELRGALKQADPVLANSRIETMNQIVAESYGSQSLAAHVLEFFGGTALLLCISGLYGLLAYMVAQRRREIGVRMALGAPREAVHRLVLRQAIGMIVPGVMLGAGLSWLASRLVRGYLFGVKAHDQWTLIVAVLLLGVSGLSAAWMPAARAASVQPSEAIREE